MRRYTKKDYIVSFIIGAVIGAIAGIVGNWDTITTMINKEEPEETRVDLSKYEDTFYRLYDIVEIEETEPEFEIIPDDVESEIYADSVEYLAMCVEAEAGNQSELGKRLVCDVILNRYDRGGYSNFYEVIDEPGQFEVVSMGRIDSIVPTEETYRIVNEEIKERTNYDVLYFRAGQYHSFGTPVQQEGSHYFSK